MRAWRQDGIRRARTDIKAGLARFSLEITEPGLPKRSWLKISQVRTLSSIRLGDRITALSPELVNQAIDGLNEIVAS
ncbi:MAG TPA: type II toxin-antitoxin system PemK/MazF family toxin [Coriobacteriia bacterium]|nr:type II toxin-antitoxin system PemK/MazF family toxin [Coriobacteriia bacterium]